MNRDFKFVPERMGASPSDYRVTINGKHLGHIRLDLRENRWFGVTYDGVRTPEGYLTRNEAAEAMRVHLSEPIR